MMLSLITRNSKSIVGNKKLYSHGISSINKPNLANGGEIGKKRIDLNLSNNNDNNKNSNIKLIGQRLNNNNNHIHKPSIPTSSILSIKNSLINGIIGNSNNNNSIRLFSTTSSSNNSNNNSSNNNNNYNFKSSFKLNFNVIDGVIIVGCTYFILKFYNDRIGVVFCEETNTIPSKEIFIPFKEDGDDEQEVGERHKPLSPFQLFWKTIGNDIWMFCFGVVTAFLSSWIGLQIPKVFGKLIDSTKSGSSLTQPALHAVAILVIQASLNFLYSTLISIACERYSAKLRNTLFESMLEQEIAFYDKNSTGDLLNRISSDVQLVRSALKHSVSLGVKSIGQIVGGTISLFLISPKLSLGMLTILPAMVGVGTFYAGWLKSLSLRSQAAQAQSTSVAEEAMSNIRTVVAFSNQEYESQRFAEKNKKSLSLATESGIQIGIFQGVTSMALSSISLLVYWYGGTLVSAGEMTSGQLTSFIIHTMNMQNSFSQLSILFTQIMSAMGGMTRITELINKTPAIESGVGIKRNTVVGDIQFRDVQFSYPARPHIQVLKGLNLDIKQGQVVALAGPSGGGKSTIASLLERFYDVDGGEILIDGVPIKKINAKWLRNHIGIVSQEPSLFATTIIENLRYGCPEATEQQVMEAAKLANAHQFIESFPLGYNTIVGERGIQLSGGQKQRIAIARAILKNPQIIILDEATSALDSESEHLVQEALQNLMKGRTTLIIAHRLSTVQNADAIAVVKHGVIVEYGSHSQLMAKKQLYYQLVQRQLSLKDE
ncbi:hypothetical protein CYY_000565 [Polysphondylium violaceum]|uniref:ABC transporter B family protein n=1 Tax=Polysphondylium violaceum TaxID=133409 RepID=A0A8J4Q3C1_9MYCE|nr:hypothetical protein CYY_000565 [Polysphondylium violaceum]